MKLCSRCQQHVLDEVPLCPLCQASSTSRRQRSRGSWLAASLVGLATWSPLAPTSLYAEPPAAEEDVEPQEEQDTKPKSSTFFLFF